MERAPDQYSGFGLRLGAFLIDGIITSVILGIAAIILVIPLVGAMAGMAITSGDVSGEISDEAAAALAVTAALGALLMVAVLTLLYWLYFVLFTGLRGQTPGKMLVGIKVVDGEGKAPGIGRAIMREVIGKLISALIIYVGYLWVLWDPERQGWHDKIAGTYVVPVQKSPNAG